MGVRFQKRSKDRSPKAADYLHDCRDFLAIVAVIIMYITCTANFPILYTVAAGQTMCRGVAAAVRNFSRAASPWKLRHKYIDGRVLRSRQLTSGFVAMLYYIPKFNFL
jgi:hypothetical protein